MFNLDDFNEIEKWCKSVCCLIDDNEKTTQTTKNKI